MLLENSPRTIDRSGTPRGFPSSPLTSDSPKLGTYVDPSLPRRSPVLRCVSLVPVGLGWGRGVESVGPVGTSWEQGVRMRVDVEM